MKRGFSIIICLVSCSVCNANDHSKKEEQTSLINIERAQVTLDSLYKHYSVKNTLLLRETFPFDEKYTAGYLASEEANAPNPYSYLWPYSGTFSAVNALFEASRQKKYSKTLKEKVFPGLDEYFGLKRMPYAYASYINSSPESDRFYDDNIWIGIDFTDTYLMTGKKEYLAKAKLIWNFVESGIDDKLGGGIYWCEQKKQSKNTCSNAPGAVYALKLFKATKDSTFFYQGKSLYEWTKMHLQDSTDNLYFDNISLKGKIVKTKYAYNSGQMLQAASLLYEITKEKIYLTEAEAIAESCYNYFFTDFVGPEVEHFRLLGKGNIWFTAVMFRGFIELYNTNNDDVYINAFRQNLDYAWKHSREDNGLFNADWSGQTRDDSKWLLTQAAMVEMYARLATADQIEYLNK